MACNTITSNIVGYNCGEVQVTGVEDKIVLLNWDDIDRTLSTFDASNGHLLTNLVMKATKKGVYMTGWNMSNDYDFAMAKGTYIDSYDHNLMFRLFKKSAEAKKWLDELKNTRVVAIVANKVSATDAPSKYEVLGWDHGLEVSELTRNQKDADTKGGFVVKLTADENNKESKMPLTLFKTDAATTETLVASLYTA